MMPAKKHIILTIIFLPLLPLLILFVGIGFVASGTATCECTRRITRMKEVRYSDLRKEPGKYAGRMIRLRAIFENDAGFIFVEPPYVGRYKEKMPAGFAKDFNVCVSTDRSLTINTGLKTWYDGIAYATVIGKYGTNDDEKGAQIGDKGFTIFCLEKLAPGEVMKSVLRNAIRFGIGRMISIVSWPVRDPLHLNDSRPARPYLVLLCSPECRVSTGIVASGTPQVMVVPYIRSASCERRGQIIRR